MKQLLRTCEEFARLIVAFICFALLSPACQFKNQIIPTATQIEILSIPTAINTEILIPTSTPIGCPPNILTEPPIPDVKKITLVSISLYPETPLRDCCLKVDN